jgi:hypothetical protein
MRKELRGHLNALVEERRERGMSREASVFEAIEQFGPPEAMSQEWRQAWDRSAGNEITSTMAATVRALKLFGAACAGTWALLAASLYIGGSDAWETFHQVMFWVMFPLPLFVGFLAGYRTEGSRLPGTFFAVGLLLILNHGITQLLLLYPPLSAFLRNQTYIPMEGIFRYFFAIVLLYWVPLGCFAAAVGGLARRFTIRRGEPARPSPATAL